jgi:hypothetical protein
MKTATSESEHARMHDSDSEPTTQYEVLVKILRTLSRAGILTRFEIINKRLVTLGFFTKLTYLEVVDTFKGLDFNIQALQSRDSADNVLGWYNIHLDLYGSNDAVLAQVVRSIMRVVADTYHGDFIITLLFEGRDRLNGSEALWHEVVHEIRQRQD